MGPSKQLFYAHSNALARSEVLKKEVEGPWKENAERKICWPHWKIATVEKFLDWLYTTDYICPYPHPVPTPTSSERPTDNDATSKRSATQEAILSFDYHGEDAEWPVEPAAKKAKTSTPVPTLKPLQDLTWSDDRCQPKISQAEEYSRWTGHQLWRPDQLDYETTLMTHAELYVMACHYLLDDLAAMSWQRLRAVLMSMGTPSVGSPVIRNLMNLFRYPYEETGISLDEEEEPLRNLLTTFAALHYPIFKGSGIEKWATSAKESDREFCADLMVKVMLRVETLEAVPGVASSFSAVFGKPPERHDMKCPKCSWQQMHECTAACSGLVGSPASSFKTKFLGSTGPGIKR